MSFGVSSGIPNVIIRAKFHVDRLRGFWAAGPPKVPFPILIGTTVTTVLHYRTDCDRPRAFQRAINWTVYIIPMPPKGGTKRDFAVFGSKIQLLSKKVCYKVSFCETLQRQSCSLVTSFRYLTVHWRICGRRPHLPKMCAQSDPPLQKTLILTDSA